MLEWYAECHCAVSYMLNMCMKWTTALNLTLTTFVFVLGPIYKTF